MQRENSLPCVEDISTHKIMRTYARFQASAAMSMRSALFLHVKQRTVKQFLTAWPF